MFDSLLHLQSTIFCDNWTSKMLCVLCLSPSLKQVIFILFVHSIFYWFLYYIGPCACNTESFPWVFIVPGVLPRFSWYQSTYLKFIVLRDLLSFFMVLRFLLRFHMVLRVLFKFILYQGVYLGFVTTLWEMLLIFHYFFNTHIFTKHWYYT